MIKGIKNVLTIKLEWTNDLENWNFSPATKHEKVKNWCRAANSLIWLMPLIIRGFMLSSRKLFLKDSLAVFIRMPSLSLSCRTPLRMLDNADAGNALLRSDYCLLESALGIIDNRIIDLLLKAGRQNWSSPHIGMNLSAGAKGRLVADRDPMLPTGAGSVGPQLIPNSEFFF